MVTVNKGIYIVIYTIGGIYSLATMCLKGTHSCVDFMDVTVGNVPVRQVRPFQVGQRVVVWSVDISTTYLVIWLGYNAVLIIKDKGSFSM